MFDDAVLTQLKQVDVSVDEDKTKERVEALWKGSSLAERKAFLEGNSVKDSNVYRIRTVGAIMPKMALYLSKYFGKNPLFLTGDMDEDTGWSDEALNVFLECKGYAAPAAAPSEKPKRPYRRRAKPEAPAVDAAEVVSEEAAAEPAKEAPAVERATVELAGESAPPSEKEYINKLSLEQSVQVYEALYIRAQHNPDAKKQYDDIERILLS